MKPDNAGPSRRHCDRWPAERDQVARVRLEIFSVDLSELSEYSGIPLGRLKEIRDEGYWPNDHVVAGERRLINLAIAQIITQRPDARVALGR
jgi:hypothetical protein